jgi:hypothetical protein
MSIFERTIVSALISDLNEFYGVGIDPFPLLERGVTTQGTSITNGRIAEAWWLNGSAPDCCPAVPGSNLASPQPTADCPSPGGLPPGMALGRGLTSVKGNRGKNCDKWTAASPKNI